MQKWLLRLGVYLFRQPKFRAWTDLEDRKYAVSKAVEQSSLDFPLLLFEYISAALLISPKKFDKVYWQDVILAFLKIHNVIAPDPSLPIVSQSFGQKDKKAPWDYSGRLWYFYSSIIASAYGWSKKQIANLSVKDGLAYIQEILTAEHFEHEFQHQLSEISYTYNKMTKKSEYKALPKPYWMIKTKTETPKPVRIKRDMLPVGVVEKIDATEKAKS